ncbi:MAG TPA: biopolymer transporter ExbD [Myxococcales bacterium]|nr:biopolymer transporter ExbD [Myxococcales bacterium]|tara:strand:- start:386 stop:793 length:408 start_codon:yes stop_codon:yes gene_type:complete
MKLGSVTNSPPTNEEPNLAPLIDIIFILLIFFVVTTTFAKDLGIEVKRPKAGTATEQPAHLVRVAVGANGQFAVDGRATSSWRLEAEVEDRIAHCAEKSVLVVADRSIDAKTLVGVMDTCRKAGAVQVAVAVDEQ